jgi:hypothetical protein
MKIHKYNFYNLLESKGVPNKMKEHSNKLIGEMFKGKFSDFIFKTGLVKMEEIFVKIKHDSENYNSRFYSKDGSLSDIELIFDIPYKPDPYYLHEIILHELTHLWEFYNIKILNEKLPMYSNIGKSLRLTLSQDNYNVLSEFRYLIYLTLDNELNARVSQVYQFLKQSKIKDKQILETRIKNSSSWKKMEIIDNFNPNKYYDALIDSIGGDLSLILINDLNKELINNEFNKSFIKELKSLDELKSYLKSWSKLFKYKMKKHRIKLLKVIYEIIKTY